MEHFYEKPNPASLDPQLTQCCRILMEHGMRPAHAYIGFFAAAFARWPEALPDAYSTIDRLASKKIKRRFLWPMIHLAVPEFLDRAATTPQQRKSMATATEGLPARLLDVPPDSVEHLDMLWGGFYATGDTAYVRSILDALGDPRDALRDYARQNLEINIDSHPVVRAFVTKM